MKYDDLPSGPVPSPQDGHYPPPSDPEYKAVSQSPAESLPSFESSPTSGPASRSDPSGLPVGDLEPEASRGRRGAKRRRRSDRSGVLEALVLVLVALVLALTLKTYVAEAYEIKGRSMEPTFHNGQRVVVLKAFYHINRYDVIVFRSTEDPTKDLIKRVVGLPGETLKVAGGRAYVDGKLLEEGYALHDFRDATEGTFEQRVPPGHYYVLGDNRPDSHDSRYFEAIPEANIQGRVVARWWPLSELEAF